MIDRLTQISWKLVAGVAVAFLGAFFVGYLFFVAPVREEESTLQNQVERLEGQAAGASAGSQEEPLRIAQPSREEITASLEAAAKASGVTIRDIDFIDTRTELVTESPSASVADFVNRVASGTQWRSELKPGPSGIYPTSMSGESLPTIVITFETLKGLSGS